MLTKKHENSIYTNTEVFFLRHRKKIYSDITLFQQRNLLSISFVVLLCAFILISIALPHDIFFSWILCICLIPLMQYCLGKIVEGHAGDLQILLISYLFLSVVGSAYALQNYHNFGFYFSPRADDMRYFNTCLDLSEGNFTTEFTLYEAILALVVSFVRLFRGTLTVLDLLPVNWVLGSFVVLLCSRIGQLLSGYGKGLFWMCVFLFFHTTFIFNIVHLYRDVLMLFLFLISINCVIEKRVFRASIFGFIIFFVRGVNALLLFLYVCIVRITVNIPMHKLRQGFYVFLVLLLLGANQVSSLISVGAIAKVASPWQMFSETNIAGNMRDYISMRKENIAFGEYTSADSFTGKIRSMPIVGDILTTIPFIFGKLSFRANSIQVSNFEYSIGNWRTLFTNVYNPLVFMELLRIVLVILTFPWIIVGFKHFLFDGNRSQFVFSSFAILSMFIMNAVSFQPRHALFVIVLLPIFLNTGLNLSRRNKNKSVLLGARVFILLLVLLAYFKDI